MTNFLNTGLWLIAMAAFQTGSLLNLKSIFWSAFTTAKQIHACFAACSEPIFVSSRILSQDLLSTYLWKRAFELGRSQLVSQMFHCFYTSYKHYLQLPSSHVNFPLLYRRKDFWTSLCLCLYAVLNHASLLLAGSYWEKSEQRCRIFKPVEEKKRQICSSWMKRPSCSS